LLYINADFLTRKPNYSLLSHHLQGAGHIMGPLQAAELVIFTITSANVYHFFNLSLLNLEIFLWRKL